MQQQLDQVVYILKYIFFFKNCVQMHTNTVM